MKNMISLTETILSSSISVNGQYRLLKTFLQMGFSYNRYTLDANSRPVGKGASSTEKIALNHKITIDKVCTIT